MILLVFINGRSIVTPPKPRPVKPTIPQWVAGPLRPQRYAIIFARGDANGFFGLSIQLIKPATAQWLWKQLSKCRQLSDAVEQLGSALNRRCVGLSVPDEIDVVA